MTIGLWKNLFRVTIRTLFSVRYFFNILRYSAAALERGHVTLRFEPDRVMYDDSERMIRIFALDGLQLVCCAVSKAALAALEDDALAGPRAMPITYRRNQSLLQAIAKRKYLARHSEVGNAIVVRVDDVNAQLAALRAAEDATAMTGDRPTRRDGRP